MKPSMYLTTAAFIAALAITSVAPVFVSPANATGYDCGCEPDKGKHKKDKGKKQGNNGFGNGGNDGIPGGSGKNIKDDRNR